MDSNNSDWTVPDSLPFKGRVGVGMGSNRNSSLGTGTDSGSPVFVI